MRRIAVLTLAALVLVGGCTANDSPTSSSTTSAGVQTSTTTSLAVTASIPTETGCPDVTDRLDQYLEELGPWHLAGEWRDEPGPLSRYLDDPSEPGRLAAELGLECTAEFVVTSPFGEFADAVVAWDDDSTYALIGALVRGGSLDVDADADGEEIDVDLDFASTRLHQVGEDLYWGVVGEWVVLDSLEPVVAVAGDDPMAVVAAWNRIEAGNDPIPLLSLDTGSSWGGGPDIPDFTLYPDGRLLTHAHAPHPPTFGYGVVSYTLSDDQVAEIIEMVVATGVVDGESFENPQQPTMVDGSWLGFEFRYRGVTCSGSVDVPITVDPTPAQQAVLDLESHLEERKRSLEPTAWTPSSFVVKVERHGPYAESNTLDWPVSFDLAAGADRRCTVLGGDAAASFYADLGRIGEDYQDRYKTLFEYLGNTYMVQSIPLLPGDTVDTVPDCRSSQTWNVDPLLALEIWRIRAISDYRIDIEAIHCPFDQCEESVVTLDGSESTSLFGWGDFLDPSGADSAARVLRTIDDLFLLASHEDLELEDLVVDGIVGVPLRIVVTYPVSGASLTLKTTRFETADGTLDVEHRGTVEIGVIPMGFDEWR